MVWLNGNRGASPPSQLQMRGQTHRYDRAGTGYMDAEAASHEPAGRRRMSRQARLAEREIRNNPGIRTGVMERLEEAVSPLVRTSSRYNAIYGIRDFNRGMMRPPARTPRWAGAPPAG